VNTWKLHRPRHGGTVALSQWEICVGKEDLDYGQPLERQNATQIPRRYVEDEAPKLVHQPKLLPSGNFT